MRPTARVRPAGACHLRENRVDDAIAALRTALHAAPDTHVAHTLLWICVDRRGELRQAVGALQAYLAGVPPRPPTGPVADIEHTTLVVVDCVTQAWRLAPWRPPWPAAASNTRCSCPTGRRHARRRAVTIPRIGFPPSIPHFMLKRLVDFVKTDHALVIQWDGCVHDATVWTPGIPALRLRRRPWEDHPGTNPQHRVGNGGFSLRSRELLETLAEPTAFDAAVHRRISPSAAATAMRWNALRPGHRAARGCGTLRLRARATAGTHLRLPRRAQHRARVTGDPALAALDFLFD